MNTNHLLKLPKAYYQGSNVVEIARDLIGKYLITNWDNIPTAGKIVETEAYDGRQDRACHAYMKRTDRTKIMYASGGIAYVYLCYGIHHLFNVVTNKEGFADAILIRALEPMVGLEVMKKRRNGSSNLASGPGVMSQAMGITTQHNALDLTGDQLYIAEDIKSTRDQRIEVDRRIGVDYAAEDALLPWRFFDGNSKYVSKGKQKSLVL